MAEFNLPFGVRIANNDPVDYDRYIAADIAARNNLITEGRAYTGLQVFVESEEKLYILKDLGTSSWEEVGSGGALSDLSDVSISNPPDGSVLLYDSTSNKWVSLGLTNVITNTMSDISLGDLGDVSISPSAGNGNVLTYENGIWIDKALGGGNSLSSLTDVSFGPTPNDASVLVYSQSLGYWTQGSVSNILSSGVKTALKDVSLGDLGDVSIGDVSSGNLLTYQNGLWITSRVISELDGSIYLNSNYIMVGDDSNSPVYITTRDNSGSELFLMDSSISLPNIPENDFGYKISYDPCDGYISYTKDLWKIDGSLVSLSDGTLNLDFGILQIRKDGGAQILSDMEVTDQPGIDVEESYSFNLDGNSMLRVWGITDGSGGLLDKGVVIDSLFQYIGDPRENGSWRFYIDSSSLDLVYEKRIGGDWKKRLDFEDITFDSSNGVHAFNGLKLIGQIWNEVSEISSSNTINTNCDLGNFSIVDLAGSGTHTLSNPTNIKPGARYTWIFKLGITVNTFNFGTAFKFEGGVSPDLTGVNGDIHILEGISDGTSIYAWSKKDFS